MYDPAHLGWANDAFWQAIRSELPFETPENLTRSVDLWALWHDPGLLFGQTCGLPFAKYLSTEVHYVATPDYGLPGCPLGHYYSAVVARIGDAPRPGARLAFNDRLSQSGWAAAQGLGFDPEIETGSHAASLAAVQAGTADVALIDAHTLRLIGLPVGLRSWQTTKPTPAPPFITARQDWIAPLREALQLALNALTEYVREALHMPAITIVEEAAYHALLQPSEASLSGR
ncbi:MAG: PhnD/SsuA/transferrin family substrate-binding protein [Pseudomonadota bacterium]